LLTLKVDFLIGMVITIWPKHYFSETIISQFTVGTSRVSRTNLKCFRIINKDFIFEIGFAVKPLFYHGTLKFLAKLKTSRGVTRLDGTRGKKQVWRPQVRT